MNQRVTSWCRWTQPVRNKIAQEEEKEDFFSLDQERPEAFHVKKRMKRAEMSCCEEIARHSL